MSQLLNKDLEFMLENTNDILGEFKNKTILITGGSGFVGSWVTEFLLYASNKLDLNLGITVLTRSVKKFEEMFPHIDRSIDFIQDDVRSFDTDEKFDYIVHLASHEGHRLTISNPLDMFEIVSIGAWNTLRIAKEIGCKKFLYMSSGSVENGDRLNPYIEGKRVGELLCNLYYKQYGMDIKIARGFNFVGARLPLNKHFAIGNFIGDVLNGKPIEVKTDGYALRSYLYMADVVVWLLTILIKGESCVPYNVGSFKATTIGEIARRVSKFGNGKVEYNREVNGNGDVYYPKIDNVTSLGVKQNIFINETIKRTIEWNVLDVKHGLMV